MQLQVFPPERQIALLRRPDQIVSSPRMSNIHFPKNNGEVKACVRGTAQQHEAFSVYESINKTQFKTHWLPKFLGRQPHTSLVENMADFRVVNTEIQIQTRGEITFTDLTQTVNTIVKDSGVKNGVAHVFAPHATGILILTENDPALLDDIKIFLEQLVPKRKNYYHPANAHAHLRSMVLPPDKTLPVVEGEVVFGTWQSLLFVETDVYPRERRVLVQVMGV